MRARHGWDTALDLQMDLIQAATTREGREFLFGVAESFGRAGQWDSATGAIAPRNPEYAHQIVNASATVLRDADPFFVSDELSEVIDYAAEKFKPEPLLVTDLTVPSGFAYFEQPLHIADTNGHLVPFRAFQWHPLDDRRTNRSGLPQPAAITDDEPHYTGILFAMYQHRDDEDPYAEARDLPPMPKVGGSDLTLSYVTAINFGGSVEHLHEDESIHDMYAHLKTFFRLCQQTIAVPRFQRVSRPTWKRALRRWKPITQVVVFTLRRAKAPQHDGEVREVNWTHRWLVNGHWRNQWYPSEKTHRQIWIAPHVRGPEDKPLIFKRRAFELVR